MIQFENMRGNASPRGKGTDAPANARWGNTNPRNYETFSSAALDPHPTVANPLLPFGKVTQTVIDGLTVVVALLFIGATFIGVLASLFILFFVKT